MREIANERCRFGYRRLAILLKREGKGMTLKKAYRLYREKRLTVRKRGSRKRALGTRAPMAIPQEPNLFPSLAAARWIIEAWRTDYNTVRSHSSLGGLAPAKLTNRPRRGRMNTEAKLSAA
jgi:hypothetical protein